MSESIDHWVRVLGAQYAPTLCFELENGLLGMAWQNREQQVSETTYVEFILCTIVEPNGHIQHYTTYSVPKEKIKRLEPYRWNQSSALGDLFHQLKATFFRGEKK